MEVQVADFDENEVTSCFEIAELRKRHEEMSVAALEIMISDVVRECMEKEQALGRERLREELERELRTLRLLEGMVASEARVVSDEVQQINDLQGEIRQVQSETDEWQERLEEVQERNFRILDLDPVYLLMREEEELRAELKRLSQPPSRDTAASDNADPSGGNMF